MDNTEDKLNHLSLCAGYGGIDLGLEQAGFNVGRTVFVEVEAFAGYNLVKKVEAGALGQGILYPDLKRFPYRKFRGCFDILSGGFPCQPFSQAGKGKGDEDPRHLFPFIKDGISACRPSLVVLENVDGISSAKLKGDHWNDPAGTPVLLHVLRELERVGYRATAVPTSASEVGAPHQRNRWFIIGVADEQCKGLEGHAGDGEGSSKPGWFLAEAMRSASKGSIPAWPSRPGQEQYGWEPPRVVGNPQGERRQKPRQESGRSSEPSSKRQAEPPVGRNPDGHTGRMDYAELCRSSDNRTDELRLLGNGVCPSSCADAVRRGLAELAHC